MLWAGSIGQNSTTRPMQLKVYHSSDQGRTGAYATGPILAGIPTPAGGPGNHGDWSAFVPAWRLDGCPRFAALQPLTWGFVLNGQLWGLHFDGANRRQPDGQVLGSDRDFPNRLPPKLWRYKSRKRLIELSKLFFASLQYPSPRSIEQMVIAKTNP